MSITPNFRIEKRRMFATARATYPYSVVTTEGQLLCVCPTDYSAQLIADTFNIALAPAEHLFTPSHD